MRCSRIGILSLMLVWLTACGGGGGSSSTSSNDSSEQTQQNTNNTTDTSDNSSQDNTDTTQSDDTSQNNDDNTQQTATLSGVQLSTTTQFSVKLDQTAQLQLTGQYSDNSTANVTNSATWQTQYSSVLTVQNGLITPVQIGQARVTASLDGYSQSVVVDIVAADDNTDDVTIQDELTILLRAPADWTTAKIYYWQVSPVGSYGGLSWPGVDMESLGEQMYRFTFKDVATTNIIFTDGQVQTGNLEAITAGGCYDFNASAWVTDCVIPPQKPAIQAEPAGGAFYNDTQTVTIQLSGDDAIVARYTLDGSDPKLAGLDVPATGLIQLGDTVAYGNSIQLRVYAENSIGSSEQSYQFMKTLPPEASDFSWDNATVYFVLTDRFYDGDATNNHAYGRELDQDGNVYAGYETRQGTFHGGDLQGLTAKLNEGYFTELGVSAIWITAPYEQIHGYIGGNNYKHYAYHGYYALDFTEVDGNMGSEQDLRTFIDTAHAKGIRVIFDVVMNHAGYDSLKDMDEFGFGVAKAGWESYYYTANSDTVHYSTYNQYIDTSSTTAAAWSNWWGADWIRKSGYPGYDNCDSGGDTLQCLVGLPDFKTEGTQAVDLPPVLRSKWSADKLTQEQAELDAFFQRTGRSRTVSNHLIKWLTDWVREYGVDGFRVDTAKHVDMAAWASLKQEAVIAYEDWKQANPDKWPDDRNLPFWMTAEVFGHGLGRSDYFDNGFDSVINFSFQGEAGQISQLESIFSRYASEINQDDSFNVLSYISSHDTALFNRNNLMDAGTSLLLLPGAVQIYYGDESKRPEDTGFDGDQVTRSNMNWNSLDNALLSHWRILGQFRRQHVAIGAGQHQQLGTAPYSFSRIFAQDKVVIAIDATDNQAIAVGDVFAEGSTVTDYYTGRSAVVSNATVSLDVHDNGVVLLYQ